jgi:hypothetical protein
MPLSLAAQVSLLKNFPTIFFDLMRTDEISILISHFIYLLCFS